MNEEEKDTQNQAGEDRRAFIRSLSGAAVAGGLGMIPSVQAADKSVDGTTVDLHICRGLNTTTETVDGKPYPPGTSPKTNIPAKDLHGCQGGNSCAGLGGCGTGDYETQYWVGENNCASDPAAAWNGTGGCGVPLGASNTGFICSQLNNAVPTDAKYPMDYVGVPVWAIARSRFEAKMVENQQAFDKPAVACSEYTGNSWQPGTLYSRGTLPKPRHDVEPPKKPKPTPPS